MKQLTKTLGKAALLAPLAACAATGSVDWDSANTTTTFRRGESSVVMDTKAGIRTDNGYGIFARSIGRNPEEGDSNRFSLADVYGPTGLEVAGGSVDWVLEGQDIPGVANPSIRAGVQHYFGGEGFGENQSWGNYSLITRDVSGNQDWELVTNSHYRLDFGDSVGVSGGLEHVTNVGDSGHNFSVARPRLDLHLGDYYTVGLGADVALGNAAIDFDEVNFGPTVGVSIRR